MTPRPRNQDLPPVIPNPTVRPGSFGDAMTLGPRNQDLSPVIPNSTLGDGWTPSPSGSFGASDMTPELRSHDLPLVIPNPTTLADEWSSLIHLLQIKDEERKRVENLLKSALAQLEVEVERRDVLGARVRELEERVERVQTEQGGLLGGDASKEMLAEQTGRVSGGAEVEEGLILNLSNTQTELRRIKEGYRVFKIERDDSDRALFRARTFAREMKEKAILIQAREQGRQEGFEEGLKQGRLLRKGSTRETPGERSTDRSPWRNTNRVTTDVSPSQTSLEAESAIRSITEREDDVRLELKAVERELDMERVKVKDLEREKGRLEKTAREERERRKELERDKEREASQAKENENEREMILMMHVKERDRLQRAMEQLELEKDKIREQMEKEKQDVEKKLAEVNKDKVKVEQLLKEEKGIAVSLLMSPPPRPISSASEVSDTPSSESYRQRCSSIDSQASTIDFDMLQLPYGESMVSTSEDGSAGKASPIDYGKNDGDINRRSTPNGSSPHQKNQPNFFTPPHINAQSLRRSTSNASSFIFVIEPPSRPVSVESNYTDNAHNTYHQFIGLNHRPIPPPQTQTRSESLAAILMLPRYTTPDDTLGIPTRPNSPVDFMGTIDVNGGGFPPGFVPQSITDAGGRATPIIGGGGAWGAPNRPPSGFGDGGMTPGFRPMTPPPKPSSSASEIPRTSSTESHQQRRSSTDSQASTIEFDMLQLPNVENAILASEDGSAGRVSPSVNSASGSASTAALPSTWFTNPPIDYDKNDGDINRRGTPNGSYLHHQNQPNFHTPPDNDVQSFLHAPFPQYPRPPLLGLTGRTSSYESVMEPPSRLASILSTEESQFRSPNHRPIPLPKTQTRAESPVAIPNPSRYGVKSGTPTKSSVDFMGTSDVNGGGFPSGFVPQSITDARGRSTPIIGGGGAWGAPSRPPSGFGGGGMSPGPKNQHLSPVIPNPTVGSGGAWGAPNRPPSGFGGGGGGGGMTPGLRNQDLPPVVPNSTMGGGWTPSRPPRSGGRVIARPRNHDLSPVIPTTTVGSGWNTSSRAAGSFGGGVSSTPRPRNQDLPPIIPDPTVGGGWGTPGHAAGLTAGRRTHFLSTVIPPVAPNPTVGGRWSTPGHTAGSFSGGAGSTSRLRRQYTPFISPVVFSPSVGGRWSTPGHTAGSFGGGADSTAGHRRGQILPPVIPPAAPSPMAGGRWSTPGHTASSFSGGASSTSRPRRQYTPFIPPVVFSPSVGGRWSTPGHAAGSFGGGAGSTAGHRSQNLPPVIPNPAVGGRWSTPGHAAGSFGSAPGPRSQHIPPVIPNPTLGVGWSTPGHATSSFGSAPGSRNQYLPPVIPNPPAGGGWSTPGHAAGSFGSTTRPRSQYLHFVPNPTSGGWWSMANHHPGTPGSRSQDFPPVIQNPTLGGRWSAPSHTSGGFVGGAGSRPGSRNQNLPSVGGGDSEFYQHSSITYGSPYPNGEGVGEDEDEDSITALNTKMNATFSMDVGSSTGAGGGGRGRMAGKKGKKR